MQLSRITKGKISPPMLSTRHHEITNDTEKRLLLKEILMIFICIPFLFLIFCLIDYFGHLFFILCCEHKCNDLHLFIFSSAVQMYEFLYIPFL